ncbi:MAG: helix-turn-helix transcriptional regulator [bacterium]
MGIKQAVVSRIIQLCKEKNITYNQLAVISGLTPSTVYSILDINRKNISIVTLKILCDGLDIKLSEFFDTNEFNNLEQEIY